MEGDGRCPFLGSRCTGGELDGGVAGCAYKERPGDACDLLAEVPAGQHPRDWLNAMHVEAAGTGGGDWRWERT